FGRIQFAPTNGFDALLLDLFFRAQCIVPPLYSLLITNHLSLITAFTKAEAFGYRLFTVYYSLF
ncbi:MAG: hypothetical protein JXA06_10980, partial [Bacteroidetes bacterium]|nr:hypothetical protein [Bacteroidota bacterium]